MLIMLGNGMHFTLIGLRGGVEGFSALELSVITSGYFVGFLSGARYAPVLVRRVGHVRVFAVLGSFMSAESWLNNAANSVLFIGASILVSISFAPILLSATPVPATEASRRLRCIA